MKCRECGADMYLDDKDYNFKGNYDNYWNCEKCQTSCIEQVRFAKPFKEIWHSENDGVKDYTIRRYGRHTGWCPTEIDFCSYGKRKEGAD